MIAEDLRVVHGDVVAVDGVSLSVDPGEVVVLLGPNGAGKTSTVETLEGYRRPAAGRVAVLGLDPVSDRRALAPRIGVMLQEGGVYPGIRVAEAVRLFAAYFPEPLDPGDLIDRLGLAHRARSTWRQLSGGEQQRLSLALALVGRPRVVFLDEPTAGVDVSGRRVIRDVIRELRSDGVAVLVTTHELDEAERIADRVVIIDRGRVVASGTVSDLRADGRSIHFGAPPGLPTGELAAALGVAVEETEPGEYVVACDPTPEVVARLTAWLAERSLPLADLRAGRHRLEDVFIRLTSPGDEPPRDDRGRSRRRGAARSAGRRR